MKRNPGESYSKVALQCAGSHCVHRTAVFFEVEREMSLFSTNGFHLDARFAAQTAKTFRQRFVFRLCGRNANEPRVPEAKSASLIKKI